MKQTTFGKTAEGTEASLYTICNSKGMYLSKTEMGKIRMLFLDMTMWQTIRKILVISELS